MHPMRFRTPSPGFVVSAALMIMGVALLPFPGHWLTAQAPQVKTSGSTFYAQEGGRNVALFKGDATQQPEGVVLLRNFRMETLSAREEPEMIITSPECRFKVATRSAASEGPIKLRRADGLFSIEGTGFDWNQQETRLAISNQVRAVIRRTVFATTTNALPQ